MCTVREGCVRGVAWSSCKLQFSSLTYDGDGVKHTQVTGRGEGGNPATLIALLDKHAGRGSLHCCQRIRWLEHVHLEALSENLAT